MTVSASSVRLHCSVRSGEVSALEFAQQLLKMCPSLGGGDAIRMTSELFSGNYTPDNPALIQIENEPAWFELRSLCKAYRIDYSV
jgi:hypothetical protein